MAFSTLKVWCNHHLCLVSEPFRPPKEKPVPIRSHSPALQAQPLANISPLSVSMDLPVLGVPYKWNQIWPFAAHTSTSFLFVTEQYSTAWVDHTMLIHLSVDGQLAVVKEGGF